MELSTRISRIMGPFSPRRRFNLVQDFMVLFIFYFSFLSSLCFVRESAALNVVVFLPGTSDSDRQPFNKIAQHLAFKGHGVATFKPIILPEQRYLVKQKLHLVKELQLNLGLNKSTQNAIEHRGADAFIVDENYNDFWRQFEPVSQAYAAGCKNLLDSDLSQKLSADQHDVAIVPADNPCILGLVYSLSIPFIYYDSIGLTEHTLSAAGYNDGSILARLFDQFAALPVLTDVLPSWFRFLPDWLPGIYELPILLPQCIRSYIYSRLDGASVYSLQLQQIDASVTQLFQNDYEIRRRFKKGFPKISEIRQQAALYFVSSDPLLESIGQLATVVNVAGVHMEYPRELFEPWSTTLTAAEDGVILVSFGTLANTSAMPTHFTNALFEAATMFPRYTFLVRTTPPEIKTNPAETRTDTTEIRTVPIPSNVNLTAFLPQQDLLGSSKVKLLITNGGIRSIFEASSNGVPILGVPLWTLDFRNLEKVEQIGCGIAVPKSELTTARLVKTMQRLLTPDNRYKQNAQKFSSAFRDRLLTPFESAIYWIEYIGRNHGSKALQKRHSDFAKSAHPYLVMMVASITIVVFIWWFIFYVLWRQFQQGPEGKLHKKPTSKCSDKCSSEKND